MLCDAALDGLGLVVNAALHALAYKRRAASLVPVCSVLSILPFPQGHISGKTPYRPVPKSHCGTLASVPNKVPSAFLHPTPDPLHVNTMILQRANEALQINPPAGQQRLTVHGSNWLWAVTAVFILEFVGLYCFDI